MHFLQISLRIEVPRIVRPPSLVKEIRKISDYTWCHADGMRWSNSLLFRHMDTKRYACGSHSFRRIFLEQQNGGTPNWASGRWRIGRKNIEIFLTCLATLKY